jgi:ubiquinone/menaquinone biosynthesis C-methylase UbiE
LLFSESRFSKAIRRPLWKQHYNKTCRDYLSQGNGKFLDLGYLADAGELDAEGDVDIADRASERLYEQVAGQVDLGGRSVVEVGCGSGAGSAHLTRTYHPASYVGVDLSEGMIEWCRDQHDLPNLSFMQGDAQNLPIASDSVDAVVNVESSHCYPSRLKFFEEVARVLRPGGSFLFADLIERRNMRTSSEAVVAVSDMLSEAGLRIEDCTDITKNVMAAREAVSRSPSFRSSLQAGMSPWLVPFAEESLLLTGTRSYERMASGELPYIRWRASKPGGDTAAGATETVEATAG